MHGRGGLSHGWTEMRRASNIKTAAALFAAMTLAALPATADAKSVGWVEVDVGGAAPQRVVTYMHLDSLTLAHPPEVADMVRTAPADSNTAALSRALAQTNIWTVRLMRVFEGNQPVPERRDVHSLWVSVNCSTRQMLTIRDERVRPKPNAKRPYDVSNETFEIVARNQPVRGKQRWSDVVIQHSCDQAPWRMAGEFGCLDRRFEPLGMECLTSAYDYEWVRMTSSRAMDNPAQNLAKP